MKRCFGSHSELYSKYHDLEWGVPEHNDQKLFEMLILEGAQAGLSWETILKRREGYREAFHAFNPSLVANMSDQELEVLLSNPKVIRNRLKVFSTRQNAQVFLEIQKEFGTFDKYLWEFVNFVPIVNSPKDSSDVQVTSQESDKLSNDLKKRGMKFVGSTIIYAYMQAIGMVNDHIESCWLYNNG